MILIEDKCFYLNGKMYSKSNIEECEIINVSEQFINDHPFTSESGDSFYVVVKIGFQFKDLMAVVSNKPVSLDSAEYRKDYKRAQEIIRQLMSI